MSRTHIDAIREHLDKTETALNNSHERRREIHNRFTALHDWLEREGVSVPDEYKRGLTSRCDFCRMRHQGNC